MKKRVLSLLLALAMMLSMVAVASAEDPILIDKVKLSLGEIVPGETAPAPVALDASYSAGEYYWIDVESGEPVSALENGKRYQLNIHIRAAEGYTLSGETLVIIDGDENWDYWYEDRWGEQYVVATKVFSFKEVIDAVDVLVGDAAVGAALPEVSVPEGANYAIDEVGWYDAATGEPVTALADGKIYDLSVVLKPLDGYGFNEDWVSMTINGSEEEVDFSGHDSWQRVTVGKTYSFCQPIGAVELLIDEPVVGEAPPVPAVPEGAAYTLENWRWYNVNDTEVEVTELLSGRKYGLELQLIAADGYAFDGDVEILVNGEPYSLGWSDGIELWWEYAASFLQKIDKVELTMDEPVVGGAAPVVRVGEDANYSIDTQYWQDERTGEPAEVLEDLHRYGLYACILPAEGYEFSEDTVVYLNGAEVDAEEFWAWPESLDFWQSVSFMKTIDKVELPAMPESLKPGDSLEIGMGDWGDVNYTLDIVWGALDDELNPAEMGDVAQEGINYLWMVTATPDEGYEFADDVEITVGGKAVDTAFYASMGDMVMLGEFYLLGQLQMIDKIELTTTLPAVGELEGTVQVAPDAPYTLNEATWAVSDTDDMLDAVEEPYEEGKHVWTAVDLLVKEGYIFSPRLEVYVNGEKADTDYWNPLLYTTGNVVYSPTETALILQLTDAQDDVPPPGGNGAPPTGDAGVAVYALLAVLAAGGMAVVLGKKKELI